MTSKQIAKANEHYGDMFCGDMSQETISILRGVKDADQLEDHREQLSSGEFDAAEAILLGL